MGNCLKQKKKEKAEKQRNSAAGGRGTSEKSHDKKNLVPRCRLQTTKMQGLKLKTKTTL